MVNDNINYHLLSTGFGVKKRMNTNIANWSSFHCITLLRKKSNTLLFLITATLTILVSCKNAETPPSTPTQNLLQVKIAQPLLQTITEWEQFTGHIEAINHVNVRARISGYLEKVHFKAGDLVNKGDLLFSIDTKPFIAQLHYAEAELERNQSAQILAKNNLQRTERLLQIKGASEEEKDIRSNALNQAIAAVKSAKANLYTARLNLEYTEIRAPINGRIGRELITTGNLISNTGSEPTLLTYIVSTDPVYVYVDADEHSVLKYRRLANQAHFKLGQAPVQLAIADEPNFSHTGYLDFIAPKEDEATGTVSLRGVFANPDGLLTPGFFARLRIPSSQPYSALLLTDRAIGTDQAQRFIWIVNQDNQVVYRKIELGTSVGQLHTIKSGLKPEEWVVIEGTQKLKPGMKINPERITLAEQQGAQ